MKKREGTDKQLEAAKETREESLVSVLYVSLTSISEDSSGTAMTFSRAKVEKVFPATRAMEWPTCKALSSNIT